MPKRNQLKVTSSDIGGIVVRDNDTYTVCDNTTLNTLVVSTTRLSVGKQTKGHYHHGQEEVYHFTSGNGIITVGDQKYSVETGDIVLIPDGAFHRVYNKSTEDLCFVCVFGGVRSH